MNVIYMKKKYSIIHDVQYISYMLYIYSQGLIKKFYLGFKGFEEKKHQNVGQI